MSDMIAIRSSEELNLRGEFALACSFDRTTLEGKRQAFNASQGAALSWEDALGQDFPVENILVHRTKLEQIEGGELVDFTRLVLCAPDGALLSTVSESVLQGVAKLVATFGPPPWNPPIVIVPAVEKSRKGMRYNTFTVR